MNFANAKEPLLFTILFCFLALKTQSQTLINIVPSNGGLERPSGLAIDNSGNLYVSNDHLDGTGSISKVTPNGTVSVFVLATEGLFGPAGLAFDAAGNLYVADRRADKIYKITPPDVMSVFAGSGLQNPTGLAFDASGNLFVSNSSNHSQSISKITSSGAISPFAQTGLNYPAGIAFDKSGNLFVANAGNYQNGFVSKITPAAVVSVFTRTDILTPSAMTIDALGNLYVEEGGVYPEKILKITPGGSVSTFLSSGVNAPGAMAFNASGDLFIADNANNTIDMISLGILPLSLTYLSAVFNNQSVQINWHTENEINTSHFIIQHKDGEIFTDIGTVRALSSGANNYTFSDSRYSDGVNYYRIQMVDKDGEITNSKVVVVNTGKGKFAVFPNPATNVARLTLSNEDYGKSEVSVYNATGQRVLSKHLNNAANFYNLNVKPLRAGIYTVSVTTTNSIYRQTLIIK